MFLEKVHHAFKNYSAYILKKVQGVFKNLHRIYKKYHHLFQKFLGIVLKYVYHELKKCPSCI